MEAKNYREGNYVIVDGKMERVSCYDIFHHSQKECWEDCPIDSWLDIILTGEWLLKFSFIERMNRGFSRFYISVLGTDFYMRPCCYGGFYWGFVDEEGLRDFEFPFARPLMYVHELQNLYFAITGEELLLKEENA